MMLKAHSPEQDQYDWDGEILNVLSFGPCAAHGGQHQWDYVKKAAGDKERIKFDYLAQLGETCSEYDAL